MFGRAITLFSLGETEIRIHPTFFLLLAIVALTRIGGGAAAALGGVVFIVLLFASVLLHELGHVYAARRYGIATPDVTLWPFGGIATLERMPEKPGQEIIVALAGPAVNVVIALLLWLVLDARFDLSQMAELQRAQSSLIAQVAAANITLVAFNLIPAFPMDGGRVLRAVLARLWDFARATRIAAGIGQGIAVLLGLVGLFGNPMLVIIAVFIFLAASSEAGFVEARDMARGHLASDAMITRFATLPVSATVDDAARLLLGTAQQEFPVVDGAGRPRGIIAADAIVSALQAGEGDRAVLEVMRQPLPTAPPNACLERIFAELPRNEARAIGVVDSEGRLVGYITPESISELVLINRSRARGETVRPRTTPHVGGGSEQSPWSQR